MVAFIIGFFIGTIFALFLFCALTIAKISDEFLEVERDKNEIK